MKTSLIAACVLWLAAGLAGAQELSTTDTNVTFISLPQSSLDGAVSVERALHNRRSIRSYTEDALSLAELGQLLWAAQGITQPDLSLRAAPSAGQLYPLTIYVLAGNVSGLAAGLYEYNAFRHALQRLIEEDRRESLAQAGPNAYIAEAPAILVIAGDMERADVRFGANRRKYVYLEAGHASQNVYLQAESLGLATVAANFFDIAQVSGILNLPDSQEPIAIMPVGKPEQTGLGL